MKKIKSSVALAAIPFLALQFGCQPTVKVATDEPITINLNVNIQHEIRIKVEKDLEQVLSKDSGLF